MKKTIYIVALIFFFINKADAQEIEIQHLANEGFIISFENRVQVFIDALFKKEFEMLDALSKEQMEKLIENNAQFDSVIILATHFHGDHYNSALTGEFMMKNKSSFFVAPDEAISNLEKEYADYGRIKDRIRSITPALYQREPLEICQLNIQVLRFQHMGVSPWKEAENVAFLIEFGNFKVLHLGDSKLDINNLEAFDLNELGIDVAIIPYWQVGSVEQRQLIEEHINPDEILVAHIPLNELDQAQQFLVDLGYKNTTAVTDQFEVFQRVQD